MNNEELKKKIVDILQLKLQECPLQPHGIMYRDAAEYIADALIAAGIGDVKEVEKEYSNAMLMAVKSQTISSERSRYMELNKSIAEHHAVVAERAFKRFCEVMAGRNCHAIGTINPHTLADTMYEKFCAIAEKELAEERKE